MFSGGKAKRFVKTHRPVIAHCRDRLELRNPIGSALRRKARVELVAHAASTPVRVDPHQVNVSGSRFGGRDEPKQEADDLIVLFRHQAGRSELVEEDGIRALARRAAPPAVEYRDDGVEIVLRDSPNFHTFRYHAGDGLTRRVRPVGLGKRDVLASRKARTHDGDVADPNALLFCPFCRECFEGEKECPDHELVLVPFTQLPSMQEASLPGDEERVAPYDLRFGRGWVFLSAALMFVGFMLRFVTATYPDQELRASGFAIATHQAANLWMVPAIAVTAVAILLRRRSPWEMRASRVAIPALAIVALTSIGYTLYQIWRGASDVAERVGVETSVSIGEGAVTMAVAAVLMVASSLRLGVMPVDRVAGGVERLQEGPLERVDER